MSSSEASVPKRKLPIVPLVAVVVVLLVAAVAVLRGAHLGDVRALIERGITFIRDLGAGVFFTAMAVLPAVGVPLLAFTVTAGEAFGPQIGLGGVIAISAVAMAINLALGYWIARYALRPVVTGLMKRYGYGVPRVTKENALTVALIVRLTPGPPYALQAFILGVAEVPFRLYMIVSWLAMMPWAVGGIILGKGLLGGKAGMAGSGIGVLVVAVIAVQWIRRKYFTRRAPKVAESIAAEPVKSKQ